MALLVVGFVVLLWCTAQVLVSCNKCAQDMTETCMQSLMNFTSHPKPMLARYKEELDYICNLLTPGLRCVDDYIASCLSKEQKQAVGEIIAKSMELFTDLCEDGPYKIEYLRHADCYHKVYDEGYCNDSYQQVINVTTLPTDSTYNHQTQLKKYCCAYTGYLQCSINMTYHVCGEETADFMRDHLRRIGDPLVKGQCNMNSYAAAECSSALSSTPPARTQLLIIILVSLVAGQINRHSGTP